MRSLMLSLTQFPYFPDHCACNDSKQTVYGLIFFRFIRLSDILIAQKNIRVILAVGWLNLDSIKLDFSICKHVTLFSRPCYLINKTSTRNSWEM